MRYAERQSRNSAVPFSTTICATFAELNHNCQVKTRDHPLIPHSTRKITLKTEKTRTNLYNSQIQEHEATALRTRHKRTSAIGLRTLGPVHTTQAVAPGANFSPIEE
jgi:hypothetical protein